MARSKKATHKAAEAGARTKSSNRKALEARAQKSTPNGPFAALVGTDVVAKAIAHNPYHYGSGSKTMKLFVLDARNLAVKVAPSGKGLDAAFMAEVLAPAREASHFVASFRNKACRYTITGDEVPAIWKDWKVMMEHVWPSS